MTKSNNPFLNKNKTNKSPTYNTLNNISTNEDAIITIANMLENFDTKLNQVTSLLTTMQITLVEQSSQLDEKVNYLYEELQELKTKETTDNMKNQRLGPDRELIYEIKQIQDSQDQMQMQFSELVYELSKINTQKSKQRQETKTTREKELERQSKESLAKAIKKEVRKMPTPADDVPSFGLSF